MFMEYYNFYCDKDWYRPGSIFLGGELLTQT